MRVALTILLFITSIHCYADDVLDELARRSGLPKNELQDYLANCDNSQTSMNLCAYRDFVSEDMSMKATLDETLQALPTSCQPALKKKQSSWERKRKRFCEADADKQAKGGSMRPMALALCLSSFTHARTTEIKKISDCPQVR